VAWWGWLGGGAGAAGERWKGRGMGQRGGRSSTSRVAREGVACVRRVGRRFSRADLFRAHGAVALSAVSRGTADLAMGVALPGIHRQIWHGP